MRIAMIGTGYVGLVSGACFSEFGVDVVCVDKDADKIDRLQRGEIGTFTDMEPEDLVDDVQRQVTDRRARCPSLDRRRIHG